jgi:glycerophosphoryl diester phosphodiesterase
LEIKRRWKVNTPEQQEKMDLLKEFFRAAGRNNISLFTELRARQKDASDGTGASIDLLYQEIEEGKFKL